MTNRRLYSPKHPVGTAHPAWPALARGAALVLLSVPLLAQAQLRPTTQPGNAPSLSSAPASPSASRAADYIVAVVNSDPITRVELDKRLLRTEQQLSQQGTALPAPDTLRAMVLDRLILERIQLQQARDSGIKIDDAALEQAELDVARQNQMDRTTLYRRLAQDGISPAQFRAELSEQWTLTRLRERELNGRVKVTEAEIDQFMREQQGKNGLAQQDLNLAQILIAVPEHASEAEVATLQAKANAVAQRAQAGENFKLLAHEFSQGAERDNGGEFGLRNSQRYPSLFLDATQKLAVGGISSVLRSGAGFHILKVIERREAGMTVTQSHARHILLRTGPQLSESAALSKLAELRQQLLTGKADFAQLAREVSQDGSAAQGGDLGWAGPGQFVPEFEDSMNRLALNEISPPLVSRFGVHLIQVTERRETALSPREQRELARNALREKKQDEAYVTWVEELRSRAYVELRDAPQ